MADPTAPTATPPTPNPNPVTVGDLAANAVAYVAITAADAVALTKAQTTLTEDTASSAAAGAALSTALASVGGMGVQNADGTTTAFEPNGSGGFIQKTLAAPTTPIPAPPAAPPGP